MAEQFLTPALIGSLDKAPESTVLAGTAKGPFPAAMRLCQPSAETPAAAGDRLGHLR